MASLTETLYAKVMLTRTLSTHLPKRRKSPNLQKVPQGCFVGSLREGGCKAAVCEGFLGWYGSLSEY